MRNSNSTGTLSFGPEVASAGFDDAELGLSCPQLKSAISSYKSLWQIWEIWANPKMGKVEIMLYAAPKIASEACATNLAPSGIQDTARKIYPEILHETIEQRTH